jgi:hypothetical protein
MVRNFSVFRVVAFQMMCSMYGVVCTSCMQFLYVSHTSDLLYSLKYVYLIEQFKTLATIRGQVPYIESVRLV